MDRCSADATKCIEAKRCKNSHNSGHRHSKLSACLSSSFRRMVALYELVPISSKPAADISPLGSRTVPKSSLQNELDLHDAPA